MERTLITFENSITGVVGPNGCGKSNIVDAIRWVLGEMSAKHLRGSSMEDVIFSGSENRAPLSMASVELTFSTEGYQTPPAYAQASEISIGRRLFRTGESEYLINKAPVRLKDITDLFMGTGIGTKAYSVIEQGRIGNIIRAKPEERRFFIEEVAGISKFKSRKEAALRKMEATQQNLLRLTDIITELDRQLKSLERQAKKAEKYRELKTEFEKADLALSSYRFSEWAAQQSELEAGLGKLAEVEVGLKATLQENENQLEIVRHKLLEQETQMNQVQNDLFEITNYVRLAENTLWYKKEERESLKMRLNELDGSMGELEVKKTQTQKYLEDVSGQKLFVDFEEESLKIEVEEEETRVSLFQSTHVLLQKTVEEVREEIFSKESRLSKIESEKSNLLQKKNDLSTRLAREEAELETVAGQLVEIQKVSQETDQALASLKQLKFDLSVKTDELSGELARHRENLKREEAEWNSLKEELTLKRSRLSSLEELGRNFEGYEKGTKAIMLGRERFQPESFFGTVAEFVETEPQYEGAVSAVLGEKLQYVVVKSHAQGLEAVEYLKTASEGRTSFVPMDLRMYGSDAGEIVEQQGVLGPLKNFVHLKNSPGALEEFLFGDVVLVEDLKKALDVWASNGHRKTLVTLGGEVVEPTGVITGGTPANRALALLEKKREMKELSELISKLEVSLAEKDDLRLSMSSRVNALQASLEAVKHSSVEEGIKISNQERDITHFRKEMETLAQKKFNLEKRVSEERKSFDELEPQVISLSSEEVVLKEEVQARRERLNFSKQELDVQQKSFESMGAKVTNLKVQLAQAHERNLSLDREITRLQNELVSMSWELAERFKMREIALFRDVFLEQESNHVKKVLDKKLDKKGAVETSLLALREGYAFHQSQVRQFELGLREARQKYDEVNGQLNQTTLGLSEVRNQLKYVVEQCLERHQRSLADIYKDYLNPELPLEETEVQVADLKEKLSRLGDVNTGALQEFEELKTRFEFLSQQKIDLETSLDVLERIIQKINRTTKEKFQETFELVNANFQQLYTKLFKGGHARLVLTDESNMLETGVDIVAQPPGKKLQSISLLSGGEQALTAISLIFSIFQIKPSPFCLLDEVDAPLDDANVTRYNDIIREMTDKTQFIVITHNKRTMEMADVLYGVTMQEPGVSQLVSVNLN